MNVPNKDIDRWRATAAQIRATALEANHAVDRGQSSRAGELTSTVFDLAADLVKRLDLMGAQVSEPLPSQSVPLHLLDTPASRKYLAALIEARAAAIEMDTERYGRGMSEDCSTPSAGMVDLMVCGMEIDIFGVSEAPY